MTEEEIKVLAREYIDSCTTRAGFVILTEGIKSDFIDLFVAGFMKCLEQKATKPKWHKVADGDLPKVTGDYITNIGVLTYDHYGNNIYKWHTPFCEACDYGDEVDDDEVIAWCEIPQYKEE